MDLVNLFQTQKYKLQAPIYSELMSEVFCYLDVKAITVVQRVCKHWFLLACTEMYWERQCKTINTPARPENTTWLRWFIQMYIFGTFDPTVLRTEIKYQSLNGTKNKVAIKLSSDPDVSNALVGVPLSSGKIYTELTTRRRGTEIFVGVTYDPLTVLKAKGMDIVQHPDTWAYTDGRRFGIQVQGVTFNAEPFGVNDAVGIFLNIDDREVSFYKNNVLQNKIFSLNDEPRWQIFVMLDHGDDLVEISKFEFRS